MNSKKIKPSTVLLYLALSLGAVIMVLPFLWTALSSVKSMGQIFTVPPTIIPRPFVWKNYPESLAALPFGRAFQQFLHCGCRCGSTASDGIHGRLCLRKAEIQRP